MKISELKNHLNQLLSLHFVKSDGAAIPAHFHITEIGLNTKHYIDCGGTIRNEKLASFQVWVANDTDHRLSTSKLLGIIHKSAALLGSEDLEIEVEYQTDTIGRYGLELEGQNFVLTPKSTTCLAADHCGISPEQMPEAPLFEIASAKFACCTPGGGCC